MKNKIQKNYVLFFVISCIAIFFIKVFHQRVDFPCFYLAGDRFIHGQNLYVISDPWPYKYLPTASIFFIPFALFPYDLSLILFYLVSFGTMALTYLFFINWMKKEGKEIPFWMFILVFAINVKAHFYDYANLQVNHILVYLLVLSYALLQKKKEWAAALLFAVAGVFKIIPLFIALFFLLKKSYRFVGKIAVWTIALLLAPALRFGVDGLVQQYRNYGALMKNYHQLFAPDRLYQSIPSMIARAGEPVLWSETTMKMVLLVFLAVLGSVVLKMIYEQAKSENSNPFLGMLQYSACLIFYPLVNPVGWKHGYVFLLPMTFLLIQVIREQKLYQKLYFKVEMGVFVILYCLSSQLFLGKKISDNKDLMSFNVWAAILLLVMGYQAHSALLKRK